MTASLNDCTVVRDLPPYNIIQALSRYELLRARVSVCFERVFRVLSVQMFCGPSICNSQARSITAPLIVFSCDRPYQGSSFCVPELLFVLRVFFFSGFGRLDKMSTSSDNENSLREFLGQLRALRALW